MGYLFYNLSPQYIFFLIFYFFKIKKYVISGDKEVVTSIIKKITNHIYFIEMTNINGKNIPTGYFIGKYQGCIEPSNDGIKIQLYTTQEIFDKLLEDEPKEIKEIPMIKHITNRISIFIRKGTYRNIYYSTIKLDLTHITPIGKQEDILSSIKQIYNEKGNASVFIQGVAGAGKSTIGYLLAKEINGIYCHTFNPTEPGDYLSNLIMDIPEQPIIIVIEEVDVLIKKIHKGIEKNNEIPISIYDKTSWNNFMDDLIFYKIILIFTSNMSKTDLDKLDTSYLRKGRIDEYYYMDTPFEKLKKID